MIAVPLGPHAARSAPRSRLSTAATNALPGDRALGNSGRMRAGRLPACRELLSLQHGVLSRDQALDLGFSPYSVRWRLRSGRWQRLHRGVYATFSGEPPREAMFWAAVLRVGADAVLSHQTAAELYGLITGSSTLIHVSVGREQHVRPIPGIVVHRSDRIREARHPAVTPPRTRVEETVLDLAQTARTLDDAFSWLARACAGRLTTPARLRAAMLSRKRMRWRSALTSALAEINDGVHSALEHRCVRDVERAHDLPRPERQVRVSRGGRTEYRDALYRRYGVAVETDGRLAHTGEARWRDIRRDNAAAAEGIITLRYGWADITRRPCDVAAEIAAVLRLRGWQGRPRPCGPSCGLLRNDRGAKEA